MNVRYCAVATQAAPIRNWNWMATRHETTWKHGNNTILFLLYLANNQVIRKHWTFCYVPLATEKLCAAPVFLFRIFRRLVNRFRDIHQIHPALRNLLPITGNTPHYLICII